MAGEWALSSGADPRWPFCCELPGLTRSMGMTSLSHHTDSLERFEQAVRVAKCSAILSTVVNALADIRFGVRSLGT